MSRKRSRKERRILKRRISNIIFLIFLIGILSVIILLYGPYGGFRDWIITVSETSMTHQWIAEFLYSDKTIAEVMANNRVEEIKEDTKVAEIEVEKNKEAPKEIEYADEYEKQILAPNLDKTKYDIYADEEEYRIVKIKGKGYTGFLAAIYDASKIQAFTTSKLGVTGQYLTTMAKDNNAILAINGGKFYDPKYSSNGATPRGVTYVNGECMTSYKYTSAGGIIGFNRDDVLVLSSKCTKENAEKLNIRDCVTCRTFFNR